jgi:CheY-like chemotaxis protein
MRATLMNKDTLVLIAEDDNGHFALIERNIMRSGISNKIIRFNDGQEILDFLEDAKSPDSINYHRPLLILLDIRMPKVDGLEVLSRIKSDDTLRRIPIIVLTTTGDHQAIEECQQLGCSMYVVKPVEYDKFIESIQKICRFLSILEVPALCSC